MNIILDLTAQLEGIKDDTEKEKIKNEIKTKKDEYSEYCGSSGTFYPKRRKQRKLSSSSQKTWEGEGGKFSGGGASGSW